MRKGSKTAHSGEQKKKKKKSTTTSEGSNYIKKYKKKKGERRWMVGIAGSTYSRARSASSWQSGRSSIDQLWLANPDPIHRALCHAQAIHTSGQTPPQLRSSCRRGVFPKSLSLLDFYWIVLFIFFFVSFPLPPPPPIPPFSPVCGFSTSPLVQSIDSVIQSCRQCWPSWTRVPLFASA